MGIKEKFFFVGYRLIRNRPFILSKFSDLQLTLAKSGVKVSFRAYVGAMFLISTIVGLVSFGLVFFTFLFFLELPLFVSLIFSFGLGLLAFLVSFSFIYFYPSFVASTRKSRIEANLPFIASCMSILAGAGVTPEKIFRSLAKTEREFGIGREARTIIRDMDLLGVDVLDALRHGAERSPSKDFANLLEGIISNAHSGGDLAEYLREVALYHMRERRRRLRDFLNTLGFMAEAYITILIAGPLMLIIMLSILAFLGGGSFFGLTATNLLYILTYLGLPVITLIVLIGLDFIIPSR